MSMAARLRLHKLATYRSTGLEDDEDDKNPPVPPEPPEPPTPPLPPARNQNEKKFSQEDVNRLLNTQKQRTKAEKEQLLQELEDLKTRGVTAENLDALNARITSIQNEGKTKAQLAEEEKIRLQNSHKKEKEELSGKAKTAEEKYIRYRISTEALGAAGEQKAFNPEQILELVRPHTYLAPELDAEGKPTGEDQTRVKLRDVDAEGKPVVLDLTMTEAVKRMKQMPKHQNLFDSGAAGGVGSYTKGGVSNGLPPTETAAYMAARAKDPNFTKRLRQ